jgi:hypothetical protein
LSARTFGIIEIDVEVEIVEIDVIEIDSEENVGRANRAL